LHEDFLDYDRLFNDVYRNLVGKVKLNHIFSVSGDSPFPVIELHESNLDKNPISNHALLKRGKVFNSAAKLKAHSATLLLPMTCLGMNPYKMVKVWMNYRSLVPEKYQCDTLYAKPDVNVMKKVNEKVHQVKTREALMGKKYGTSKENIEDLAFGDGRGSI
jgi:hypothetical protein